MPDDGFAMSSGGELRRCHIRPQTRSNCRERQFVPRSYVVNNKLGRLYGSSWFFDLTRPDTGSGSDVAFVSQARSDEVGDVEGYWPWRALISL